MLGNKAIVLLIATVLGVLGAGRETLKAEGGAADIDICDYRQTFADDFDSLSISAWGGRHTRWIAHTPWAGDFGDAAFADPEPLFPFTLHNGILQIEARKSPDGKWRSGLLASADPTTAGFAQLYGYFEIRAKLPPGPGLWPAFWLATNQSRTSTDPAVEIDVFEHYGKFPGDFHSVLHIWDKSGRGKSKGEEHITHLLSGSLYDQFHTYGVDVAKDWIRVYFDRKEIWRIQSPEELRKPLMILINLALGSGWPIDKAPSPSIMQVDYVHVYERDAVGRHNRCP
jgi:hypothetical protein